MIGKNVKNVTIALYFLCATKEKIYPAYVSKHNSNREKQVILFNDFKRIQTTMALSCSQKSICIIKTDFLLSRKHHVDFSCLNCFHSVATTKKNTSIA